MSQATHGALRSLPVRSFLLAVLILTWCASSVPAQASCGSEFPALQPAALQANACVMPEPAATPLSECFFGENIIIIYWSSAAHTQIVGECSQGPCPGAGCWGTKTSFVTGSHSGICEVCT
ncbi:MAG TPA: hypothetical protein VKY89_05195 [Thermoanaerobaculia bacterium]|jgi:hypothetical protein|nr:hypothetical protein [Thermoanaerobaculia bacterium]